MANPLLLIAIPLLILEGCIVASDDASANQGQSQTSLEQPKALRDNSTSSRPGDPVGCFREWDGAAQDSVLNCPDIRPPKMN